MRLAKKMEMKFLNCTKQTGTNLARHAFFLLLTVIILIYTSGCSLKEVHQQATKIDNLGSIKGRIDARSSQKGVATVVRFREKNGFLVRGAQILTSDQGEYNFTVEPGNYYIAVYMDVNGDGSHQPGEHGNFYGLPSIISVAANQTSIVDPIAITGELPDYKINLKAVDGAHKLWSNIGRVVDLNDRRFDPENYSRGLWKPFDFLGIAEGGLFFLQSYDKSKTPVLFVHGISGGPKNWETVIENLDKHHFQPWVFYYPSGMRLDMISGFLVKAVSLLQLKYKFPEFVLVAHSMGGLVSRSFVKKYVEIADGNANRIRLFVTVNSPMGGMTSAKSGVKHSPIVLPVWRDLVPDSEFLQGIQSWDWPQKIPYHLVVSYQKGSGDDGVVPLQSQAPIKLQQEASRMYILQAEHTGVLREKEYLDLFEQILANSRER